MKTIFLSMGFVLVFLSSFLQGDMILLKNGKAQKGRILFIKPDRIILMALSGKVVLKNSEIKKIIYDDEEKTLLKVGKTYFQQKKFQQALKYYEKALTLNPLSDKAKMGILDVREVIFRKKRTLLQNKKSSDTHKTDRWLESQSHLSKSKFDSRSETYVNDAVGIKLSINKEKRLSIIEVLPHSVAEKLYFFIGDIIFSINGVPTKGKSFEDIDSLFSQNTKAFHTITLSRNLVVLRGKKRFYENPQAYIDANLKKEEGGFRVVYVKKEGRSDLAGIKVNDMIVEIEDLRTDSKSLDQIHPLLEGEEGSKLHLCVHRFFQISKKRSS